MHESSSTFVPLFLSNRSQHSSRQPQRLHPLDDEFEYLGPAQRTGTDLSEQSNLSAADSMPPRQGRALFGEQGAAHHDYPSRSEASASVSSTKSHSRSNPNKKRTRPAPSRTASSSTASSRAKPSTTRSHTRSRRKITYTTRLRVAVESKLRLTLAFGFAAFASVIIYIALFVTRTSRGAVFHVLSIALILSLLGVTIHSLVRFLALNSELRSHRAHRAGLKKTPSARGWNISRPLPQFTQSSTLDEKSDNIGQAHGGYENDEFPVFQNHPHNPFTDAHDIEAQAPTMTHHPLQHPPPTYGNTRDSIRLSINPASPTYAQHSAADPNISAPAPTLAPGMPGWHPPSFRSEGGITAVLERRRREVQERLGGNGSSGRNQEAGEMLGPARYQPVQGMI